VCATSEKLIEPAPVAQRHAEHFAAFFERAEADLETRPMPVFLEPYSRRTYGLHWIGLFPRKAMGRSAWH
jgi:hypothetical protein